jgi:riboflavin synthase
MFTGLIEDIGVIKSNHATGAGKRIIIETNLPTDEIKLGDSIAVDGVCLTVVTIEAKKLSFDVSQESLMRSTLGDKKVSDEVHLERALRLSDRLGGHMVQGHVDAVGQITKLTPRGEATQVDFSCTTKVGRYLIEKGSIAVDGVSLTVNERGPERFSVVLIPHTIQKTRIVQKGVGGKVNLETDLVAKYVERLLSNTQQDGLTLGFLQEHGFAKKDSY